VQSVPCSHNSGSLVAKALARVARLHEKGANAAKDLQNHKRIITIL